MVWPPARTNSDNKMARLKPLEWWRDNFMYLILLVVGIIGLYFVVWSPFQPEISYSLGSALITTGLVGGALSWYFQQRLVEDVFKASIGYLLPEDLQPELAWIYNQTFLCFESNHHCQLRLFGKNQDYIILTVEGYRRFRNLSSSCQTLNVHLSIDEPISPDFQSEILEIGHRMGDETVNYPIDYQDRQQGETVKIKPRNIKVAPHDEVSIWHKYSILKRRMDHEYLVFNYPTKDPMVTIIPCDGIETNVAFAHRGSSDLKPLGSNNYRLFATLLPGQPIHIKWWPTSTKSS